MVSSEHLTKVVHSQVLFPVAQCIEKRPVRSSQHPHEPWVSVQMQLDLCDRVRKKTDYSSTLLHSRIFNSSNHLNSNALSNALYFTLVYSCGCILNPNLALLCVDQTANEEEKIKL